jgi:hypothetical protein
MTQTELGHHVAHFFLQYVKRLVALEHSSIKSNFTSSEVANERVLLRHIRDRVLSASGVDFFTIHVDFSGNLALLITTRDSLRKGCGEDHQYMVYYHR